MSAGSPARAVRADRFGEPSVVLAVGPAEVPRPAPGEVLVRTTARSVNWSDILTIRGAYAHRTPLPLTPGYEGVGIVEARGEGVTTPAEGARVLPLRGAGTWQAHVLAPAAWCVPVPGAIGDEAASQLYINPLTAWLVVTEALCLGPGDVVAANACGSAFGRVLVQLSRLFGFAVIAVTRGGAYTATLLELGARAVVDTSREPLAPAVARLTGGAGLAAALDAVGGRQGAELAGCLAPGGTMLHYGLLSGEALPAGLWTGRPGGRSVRGYWLRDWVRSVPVARWHETFAAVIDHVAARRLVLPAVARYDLSAVAAAVRAAEAPGPHGKVILVG